MGKKIIKQASQHRRTSTRVIKKKQHPDEEQFYQEDESNQGLSPHDDRDSQDSKESNRQSERDNGESGSGEDADESDEQSSVSEIKPENLAIRNMQFREKRGTKMNYLINRKKEEEQDPFWADMGNNYFGDLDDGDNDEEDYVQSSSGRDEFDSDFNQTESEHNEEQASQEEKEVDEDHEKQKKRRQELMRRIQAPAPGKKGATKSIASSTVKKNQKSQIVQPTSRYIHMAFNQQQLLGEAATTEYFNWLSLKKLISIETEKKDFAKRQHHIEGPKIIYRDRFNALGVREETYELEDVAIAKIQDLTHLMNQN